MIPKGANAYRPIRIECAIMRLFGAAACDQARLQVAPFLRPHQVGGGLKGGVEFGARLLDIGYNQGDTIISIDVENAFNSTRHLNIFQEIIDKAPNLARIFRWKYGTPSSMRDNAGAIVAHTCTGVGQGDPFSSVFFELALQPILLRLTEKVRAFERAYDVLHPESPIVRPGLVTAYEDDTSIRGEMAIMYDVAPYIAPIFEAYGFVVKVEKSFITGKDTDIMPAALRHLCRGNRRPRCFNRIQELHSRQDHRTTVPDTSPKGCPHPTHSPHCPSPTT